MSSNNNQLEAAIFPIVIVGMIAYFVLTIIYVVFVSCALLLTLCVIPCCFKPITLFGETIEVKEARAYITRGLIGTFAFPLFVMICTTMWGIQVTDEYWFYMELGGYALGSLGIEIIIADAKLKEEKQAALEAELLPPPSNVVPFRAATRQREAHEPFEYASWDDEDERP